MAGPAGERRIVAALFVDVAGSTTIAEQLGPDRSKFLFDEIVGLMAEQVRAFGGTVAQLTGDGLFAVFGAPVAHEDDSVRAVRAGRAIHDALGAYAGEVADAYGIQLAARVAVNTGPVVLVGERPDEQRYNALGDTANVAARLQTVAGDGGVAVGAETARQVARTFALEDLGELELKGKSAPVRAYLVAEELETAEPAARTPFIGRKAELAVLTGALQDALDGRGAVVSVTGEPGIGKSRIVREACGRIEGLRVLVGHALAYTEPIPYWPVRDLLRSWLGVSLSDPEARVRLELKAALAALDEADRYPFLGTLLGLTLEPQVDEQLRQISRDSVQQQTIDGVARVIAALAAEQPVCLVAEDLHWADDATLDLIAALVPVVEEEAVVLILLHRSERDHRSWELAYDARRRVPHRFREVELEALDESSSRQLAAAAAEAELPDTLAALIAERAGGNPFFLEEAMADLLERGALAKRDGQVELAVPSAVQEALQARLDRLDAPTREVVNVAAAIGQSFGLQLLERVAPADGLRTCLSELQRLDLVVEERRREYRFRHGLVQEVAYRSLLEPRRRALHGAVGRALEDLHRDSLSEVYGLLAWHFGQSDAPGQAVEYLLKAGDAARALFANREAREYYREALDLMGDDARARSTLLKLGLSHHLDFEFGDASRAYEQAFALRAPSPERQEPEAELDVLLPPINAWVPGYAYNTYTTWLVGQLFRGLLTVDADLNLLPDVAERFELDADGLTYRFRLRADATWSDGVAVAAEDFAYAYERMRADQAPSANLLDNIERATASDGSTLEIRLRSPSNGFLHLCAMPFTFPWPKHRCEELGDGWRLPETLVSNGPFEVEAVDPAPATLRARPGWHGARGNIRRVSLDVYPMAVGMAGEWAAGRGDIFSSNQGALTSDEHSIVERDVGLGTSYLGFHGDRPPFHDERVRRAFARAIDVERLALLWGGPNQPARGGFVPPRIPGHSHGIAPGYDPAAARGLLAEAGYAGGKRLPDLTLTIDDGLINVAAYGQALVEMWAALGANVTLEVADFFAFDAAVERADLWCWGWSPDVPDPDAMLRPFFAVTPSLHVGGEIDAAMERVLAINDLDERLAAYREIDRMLVSERVALVPLHYAGTLLARRPWVHGYRPNQLLVFGSPLDWITVDVEARNKARSRQT